MSQTSQNSTGYRAFTATAAAIAAHIRVTQNSAGLILAAGATENWIGTVEEPVAASGIGTVRLRNSPGTHQFVASAAITCGAQIYPTASGKVDDASAGGAPAMGFLACEAAGTDGDVIECAPYAGGLVSVAETLMIFPINLASVADGDVFTAIPLTFAGTFTQVEFRTTVVASTGGKATTLNLEINTTNLTGGAIALTTANQDTVGGIIAGTAITAANTFAAGDTFSVEASSTTAFAQGAGLLIIHVVAS